MNNLRILLNRAEAMIAIEENLVFKEWWRGYKRGLWRCAKGTRFGTQEQHELMMSSANSKDKFAAARGRGYNAGLSGEWREP